MIVIPLPHYGFDPTEAAIPWKYLNDHSVELVFATPDGHVAAADKRLLTGEGFGIFKSMLMANDQALSAYQEMSKSEAFNHPISYSDIVVDEYQGILLPGGHDKGMKNYLESSILQRKVVDFFDKKKIIGAICHGTVLAARSIDPISKRSVLFDYKTTSLLKLQEMGAYYLTVLWLHDYYRTYPLSVEEEVKSVLKNSNQFKPGRFSSRRDTFSDEGPAFVVEDRNYISGRWPGDAHTFAKKFFQHLKG